MIEKESQREGGKEGKIKEVGGLLDTDTWNGWQDTEGKRREHAGLSERIKLTQNLESHSKTTLLKSS